MPEDIIFASKLPDWYAICVVKSDPLLPKFDFRPIQKDPHKTQMDF